MGFRPAQEMAVQSQVIDGCRTGQATKAQAQRAVALALFFAVCLMVFSPLSASAAGLTLVETEWRTGEIEVKYEGAISGQTIMVYAATYDSHGSYDLVDAFTANGESGSHIVQFRENGQTIWYYVRAADPATGEQGTRTNIQKQTPPITAYIINWPEMKDSFQSMSDSVKDSVDKANDDIKNKMDDLAKPSPAAQDNMKNALDNLKDAIGVPKAEDAGKDLKDALDDIADGGSNPISNDDGKGTFSGGENPDELPPLQGTQTEASFSVPITYDQNGQLIWVTLFSQEQMEKLKWWAVVYKAIEVIPWVMLVVWLVQRFTPQFKV